MADASDAGDPSPNAPSADAGAGVSPEAGAEAASAEDEGTAAADGAAAAVDPGNAAAPEDEGAAPFNVEAAAGGISPLGNVVVECVD